MNDFSKDVGKRIRQYRRFKDITQGDMAKKLNISTSTYSAIELGNRNMTLEKLKAIATILNVEVATLVEGL